MGDRRRRRLEEERGAPTDEGLWQQGGCPAGDGGRAARWASPQWEWVWAVLLPGVRPHPLK